MELNEQHEEQGFLRRYRFVIVAGVIVLIGVAVWFSLGSKSEPKRKAPVSVVNIMPPLPPPPPLPTPVPTPPPQEVPPPPDTKQPEFQAEEKPDNAPKDEPKAAVPDEPAPLGSNIQGDGSDGFGLTGRGGGGMIGGTGKGKGGGNTKWGWYGGQVQSRVTDALSKHRNTKSASLSIKVRIWADSTGRITRATLANSTGDRTVDQAIQNEVLTGLQLQEPPPADMPMPIVMRISAKRPN